METKLPPVLPADRILQQMMDFWVEPEILRRQHEGTLPNPFQLVAAQVIFGGGSGVPEQVRLNDEAKLVIKTKEPMVGVDKGQQLDLRTIGAFEDFLRAPEDADKGHMTVFFPTQDTFLLSFDFTYNGGYVRELLSVAREFLDAAEHAIPNGALRVVAENLFAVAESLAKGELLLLPNDDLRGKKTHTATHSLYNNWRRHGLTSEVRCDLYNRLYSIRPTARYLHGEFKLTQEEADQMLPVVQEWFASLEARIPEIAPVVD